LDGKPYRWSPRTSVGRVIIGWQAIQVESEDKCREGHNWMARHTGGARGHESTCICRCISTTRACRHHDLLFSSFLFLTHTSTSFTALSAAATAPSGRSSGKTHGALRKDIVVVAADHCGKPIVLLVSLVEQEADRIRILQAPGLPPIFWL
jgi:hypothetical protein